MLLGGLSGPFISLSSGCLSLGNVGASGVAPGVFFNSMRNVNGTNRGGRECCNPGAMVRLGVGGGGDTGCRTAT